ncbi:MAG: hypothetical protein KF861_24865, partial [Planctomycetaceae bacterium]|nr:hypothetical protein [Planctomycetaceae bacterium]
PQLAAQMARELSPEALRRSRNSSTIHWIRPAERTGGQAGERARPFAHPYFWAGFVHTGL